MKRSLALLLALVLASAVGCSAPPSGGMRPSSTDKSGSSGSGGKGKSGSKSGGSGSGNGSNTQSGGSAGSGGSSSGGSSGKGSSAGSTGSADTQSTITVSTQEQQLGGIRLAEVEPRVVPRTLSVPSQVMMDEQRTARISPYFDGLVIDVLKLPGDFVHRGDALAHVHSHSVHETVGALAVDFANVARGQSAVIYAQQKRDRYDHLYGIQAASLEQQQGSQQELVQAQTDLANAQAAVIMEREHLADLLQVSPESVTPATLYTYENLPIKTPITGTVITRSITPGTVIEPGNEAYTVSDLGEVWNVAAVSETELPHLRLGQHVTVRSDAWPGETFTGRVTLIGSTLDPTTRTIQVRASLANPRNKLKPLMFTTATIDETETRQAIFIPENALQEVNGVQVAFVTPDGTHFNARTLKTAAPVSGQVEVTEGLRPGDHIAVAGAFMLKSDLLKSTMDSE
jgi:multidrug efflux pump subunit AcrA (membrane-fusion protein)